MTAWLDDGTLQHLRDVAEWPDLGARYEVTGRLGRGGMGAVFAAHDRVLDREVAVKVLDRAGTARGEGPRRVDEATILARLEHPGIVSVHDAGTLGDGRAFYVMRLVRGVRLVDALQSEASIGRRLELFLRVCDAVSFAHAHGIIHRDLKPENVMVGPFGEVLVMDWGIARVLGSESGPVIAGTPGFMAPEQASGATDLIDPRTDVYALGALLASMLPSPVPKRIAAIARRARDEHPDRRYPSVNALAKDVVRFRDGDQVEAYRESLVERTERVYQRYRVPILLVMAYMVMRVALLVWGRI